MGIAFLFPGQGSQSVGMLSGLEAIGVVREVIAEANDALGFDLGALMAAGPAEELNRTVNAQPALLTAGVAAYRAWRTADGCAPERMAGHSLGEYTALVCAEALPFADGLRLVRRRGELMQNAAAEGVGAMAAILGLDEDRVRAVCREAAGQQVVEAVNFNAPGQVVIAGHRQGVERAVEQARAAGARKALTLGVSVPAHSSLMRPAAGEFAAALAAAPIRTPRIPIVNNVDVREETDPERIRDALLRQLYSPVRWIECIRFMRDRGIDTVVECGPGRVLAGLARRIDAGLKVHALTGEDALRSALETVAKGETDAD